MLLKLVLTILLNTVLLIYLFSIVFSAIIIAPDNTTAQPCTPNPCEPNSICDTYGDKFAVCNLCVGPNAINKPGCRPECVLNSDCPFNKFCLKNKCVDPCPGSCGVNAECILVYNHEPICQCKEHFEGNPYEHCKFTIQRKYFFKK